MSYLLGVAVITLHCVSLFSDIANVKFLICFMKHHVNVSSLMMDKIYKLSRIRRILVWLWVDLNQFDILNYLIKGLVYSWNASKYWLFIWKATNILRQIQKYLIRILPYLTLCLGKIQPLTLDVPMEHLSCVTKHVNEVMWTCMKKELLPAQFQQWKIGSDSFSNNKKLWVHYYFHFKWFVYHNIIEFSTF